MADRPTKPGFYWYLSEGVWSPVEVRVGFGRLLWVGSIGNAADTLLNRADGTWGPEIVLPEGL